MSIDQHYSLILKTRKVKVKHAETKIKLDFIYNSEKLTSSFKINNNNQQRRHKTHSKLTNGKDCVTN